MVPHQRFLELLQDIEPSSTTKSNASAAHTALRSSLWNNTVFSSYLEDDFLSGSYKRDTAIRPRTTDGVSQRPDVDIIVVTSHSLADCPLEVLDLLFEAVSRDYPDARLQSRSVGVETSLADMDVVPVIDPEGNGNYYIPDRDLETWVRTNPPGHTLWTTDMNVATDGRFKPLVKLGKWWRRHNRTVSKRPKGFVVECIFAACMDPAQTHFGELFVGTLESIVSKYSWAFQIGWVPNVNDPSVPQNSVTGDMTFAAFEGFYRKAQEHAAIGRRALTETDLEVATGLWRQIFGDRFPKTAIQKSDSLLRPLTTPTLALNSLAFPPKPIVPVKPAGFA